jgi:arylsulfatase A-like enzyme
MADQPVAALLKDLKQRGLLDETLVIFAGEFGRTPLGENRMGYKDVSGRDHHPFAFSLWMAGGGVKGGLTYGATDEIGWSVIDKPVHINDFHATILKLFGFDHLKLTVRNQGLDARLTGVAGNVIDEWIA